MDHALLVGMFDRVRDLARVVEHRGQVQRALVDDDRLERLARHVLHDDEEGVVLLLGGDDVDDVRMIERGEQPRFAKQLAEVEILPVGNLDGDALVDPRVFRQVHGAEPAAPERLMDAVLAEHLSAKNHWSEAV